MRILFYNWVDYLDDEKRGGGVTVYQRNVIRALADAEDVEASFISSGISYDLLSGRPRWEKVRHGPVENRANRYEIVNSGVLSPSHHSFFNRAQVSQPETAEVFFDFMRRKGPFDVVHFNNLEGVPAEILKLKDHFPETRVVLSLHNYYPFCPQVNLWFQENENCRDYELGMKCHSCLPHSHDERIVRLANAVAFNLKKWGIRPGTRLFDRAFLPSMRLAKRLIAAYARLSMRGRKRLNLPAAPPRKVEGLAHGLLTPLSLRNRDFQNRREDVVALINAHCDVVLGVSDRVCDVAAHFGVKPALLHTSYIGTNQAERFSQTAPKATILREDGTLTLAYLGYMRRDKGFFFLLDALAALPAAHAARIRLVVCAARGDDGTMHRLAALSDRFAGLYYANGYSHEHLDDLLADVDVGLVPVLWEDNLPQVAIEMHARHIPLLTSDLGGAKELSNCAEMVFPSGSIEGFAERISALLDGKITSEAYWKNAQSPVSMPAHLAELRGIWTGPLTPSQRLPKPLALVDKPAAKLVTRAKAETAKKPASKRRTTPESRTTKSVALPST